MIYTIFPSRNLYVSLIVRQCRSWTIIWHFDNLAHFDICPQSLWTTISVVLQQKHQGTQVFTPEKYQAWHTLIWATALRAFSLLHLTRFWVGMLFAHASNSLEGVQYIDMLPGKLHHVAHEYELAIYFGKTLYVCHLSGRCMPHLLFVRNVVSTCVHTAGQNEKLLDLFLKY